MMMSLLVALLAAAQPAAAAPPPPPVPAIPLPGWMAGCWMTPGEGSRTEECWTVPRGTMMLASSHMFNGPRTIMFEHLRIVQEGGTLVYIAQPRGAPPTRFVLANDDDLVANQRSVITFRNAANVYPQRIRYRQLLDGGIVAEISQLDGSRLQSWTFRRSGQ